MFRCVSYVRAISEFAKALGHFSTCKTKIFAKTITLQCYKISRWMPWQIQIFQKIWAFSLTVEKYVKSFRILLSMFNAVKFSNIYKKAVQKKVSFQKCLKNHTIHKCLKNHTIHKSFPKSSKKIFLWSVWNVKQIQKWPKIRTTCI